MPLQLSASLITPTSASGLFSANLDSKVFVAIQRTQNLLGGQVLNRARHYPPEIPGQVYKRTNTLKAGWKLVPSRSLGDTQEVVIYNDAVDPYGREYAGFVYGFNMNGAGQSIYHRGRWPTQQQLLNQQSYANQVQNAINRVIAGG